jgi:hypothetical protein
MEKYSFRSGWFANSFSDWPTYAIIHTENGKETHIAVTDTAEKAHLICKALNRFWATEWVSVVEQAPEDYEHVVYFDSRDGKVCIGFFVWSQTPVNYVTHWMKLPPNP